MFTKFSKEPIKTWSNQWMIDNGYHHLHVTLIDFKKANSDKLELKLEKVHHKIAKALPSYNTNQLQLLREVADKLKNVRFNFKLSTLK
jgi:hypothetical protein